MEFWSWILTIIGLTGFYLAGRKVWWCWYVNIANQIIWAAYAVITQQWGFLVGVGAYTFIFTKNAISWTEEHRKQEQIKKKFMKSLSDPRVRVAFDGDQSLASFEEHIRANRIVTPNELKRKDDPDD